MDYRVILIEKKPLMLERLAIVVENIPGFALVGSYHTAEEAIREAVNAQPNLLLLDTDGGANMEMMPVLQRVFSQAGIICIDSQWDARIASNIAQAGAKGYLIKPFTGEELCAAVESFGKSGMGLVSDVMTFFSAKGKSGKTTLIANLALSLARKSGQPVAIIDADLQFGDIAVFFNLQVAGTIVEAVRDVHFLSPITLGSYFVPVNEKVNVLCGTRRPEMAEMVEPKAFAELVKMARSLYRYILIDLPSAFNPLSIAAAELADETFVVAMDNGGFELQHMRRALQIFQESWPEDYEKRLRPVISRVSPCDRFSQKKLEDILNYPLTAILPNEYVLVSEAANNGRMAVDIRPESSLSRSVDQLAEKVIGHRHLHKGAVG